MRLRIYPYRSASESLWELKNAFRMLGWRALVLRREDSRFNERLDDLVINWGATDCPEFDCSILNSPRSVSIACQKALSLQRLAHGEVPTPQFTSSPGTARDWLNDGTRVYARTMMRAHGGAGIQIVEPGGSLPEAPLYTRGINGREYRIHVVGPSVIRVQKRYRDGDDDHPEHTIRNHNNGYSFIASGFQLPNEARGVAVKAVAALGLHFGAVDVINSDDGPKVLEVNTAPGMEGSTPQLYAYAIGREFIDKDFAPVETSVVEYCESCETSRTQRAA